MIEESEVRKIVEKVLEEENLHNFVEIFKKEHNLFRGTHETPSDKFKIAVQEEEPENPYPGSAWVDPSAQAAQGEKGDPGAATFLELTDAPASYEDEGEKIVAVKATEDGLEFITLPTGVDEFNELIDTPASYSGEGGKGVRVKGAEDGLEFYTLVGTDEKVKVGVAGVADYLNENYFERDVSNHIRIKQNTLLTGVNADKWDGYQFADYLDQPVKQASNVQFDDIVATGSITAPVNYVASTQRFIFKATPYADTGYLDFNIDNNVIVIPLNTGYFHIVEYGTWDELFHISAVGLMTIAGQIKFPAVQNPSADVNTLDDYEEGTFTPYVYDGVTGDQGGAGSGFYTKIGNMVYVDIIFNNIDISGLAGFKDLYIKTLPFTVGQTATATPWCTEIAINNSYLVVRAMAGTIYCTLWDVQHSNPGTQVIISALRDDVSDLYFSIAYRIA